MGIQSVFDLYRVDVLGVAEDHVSGAGVDEEVAVFVQMADVACGQPAAGLYGLGGGFGVVPVFQHGVGAAAVDFAFLVDGQGLVVFVTDFYFHAHADPAARLRAFQIFRPSDVRDHSGGFAGAVTRAQRGCRCGEAVSQQLLQGGGGG